MKEQLYTIPVNDAFAKDCECPICEMFNSIQDSAIDFVMGDSYMQDDVRAETDEVGFCDRHIRMLYKNQNRLGLGLMMLTYMNKSIKDIEKKMDQKISAPSLFKKSTSSDSAVGSYCEKIVNSCYVCNKMENLRDSYIKTVFYLYEKDNAFKAKFAGCKGFCTKHYGMLFDEAPKRLNSKDLPEFIKTLNTVYLENFKRVRDDLDWFTLKFDYRNADAPWKNSKDALIRAIQKTESVIVEEKKK